MKKWQILFTVVSALTLSGCGQHMIGVETGHAPTPPPTEVLEADRVFVKNTVREKLEDLSLKGLYAVNEFIDAHIQNELGENVKEILVLAVERHGFPFFLEGVMRSNELLNTLPRNKERLTIVESERAPGVKNVYYTVYAQEVPEGKHLAHYWAPFPVWDKHIDPRVNLLEGRTPEQVFFSLFYEGNMEANLDLILSVQGQDGLWDWDRMVHPFHTGYGVMVIPIATIKNGAMEALLTE